MVRLVDLDEEGEESAWRPARFGGEGRGRVEGEDGGDGGKDGALELGQGENLNYGTAFARAMGCYPIISTLATNLDLTTLHSLALTCRQVRANLLAHRTSLIAHTLRCANESANPALRLGSALQASFAQWTSYAQTGDKIGRVSGGGKVGACVRDLVGECRRCGRVVCRNCITKPPTQASLQNRIRRLCRTCMKSPLTPHLLSPTPVRPPESSSSPRARPFPRSPCSCPLTPWLCRPCAQPARTADTTYMRGWAWRTAYGACGGIGAGLGEGNEGVECGRGSACLAATVVEKEIECDAETLAAIDAGGRVCGCEEEEDDGGSVREWAGSSYTTVEVVGIGGVVRRKVKELVGVGAVVKEYEDERVGRSFLQREREGANRGWCSWCERVVLGRKDEGGASGSGSGKSCSSEDSG